MEEPIAYRAIGVARTAYPTVEGMPLQSVAADQPGRIELDPELEPGLLDLDGFSHLFVLSHLERSGSRKLQVVPFLDDRTHGIFATRSPGHPNPIGLSVVRLVSVEGSTLNVVGLDLLDGTPVLDIKPYVPAFDHVEADRIGWLAKPAHDVHERRADARFADPD